MLTAYAGLPKVGDGERANAPQHVPGNVDDGVANLLPRRRLAYLVLFHSCENRVVRDGNEDVV